jgi:hypothetical protein
MIESMCYVITLAEGERISVNPPPPPVVLVADCDTDGATQDKTEQQNKLILPSRERGVLPSVLFHIVEQISSSRIMFCFPQCLKAQY